MVMTTSTNQTNVTELPLMQHAVTVFQTFSTSSFFSLFFVVAEQAFQGKEHLKQQLLPSHISHSFCSKFKTQQLLTVQSAVAQLPKLGMQSVKHDPLTKITVCTIPVIRHESAKN